MYRRIFALLLTLLCLACTVMPAFAEEVDVDINLPAPKSASATTTKVVADPLPKTTKTEDDVCLAVIALVNQERTARGIPALTASEVLLGTADTRVKECAQLFSHTRPDNRTFWTVFTDKKISYGLVGENIAYGQSTPEEVVAAWMNSSSHRATILSTEYTAIGVGYYKTAAGTPFWCQHFWKKLG